MPAQGSHEDRHGSRCDPDQGDGGPRFIGEQGHRGDEGRIDAGKGRAQAEGHSCHGEPRGFHQWTRGEAIIRVDSSADLPLGGNVRPRRFALAEVSTWI